MRVRLAKLARRLDAVAVQDENQRAIGLQLSCPGANEANSYLSNGSLRMKCTETDAAKLWRWYAQLAQAEAAFRTAKSNIGLQPVNYQKNEQVDVRLAACFLSLAPA